MSNSGSIVALATDKDELYEAHIDTSQVDESRLLRKIDIRVVPWLGLLYFLNFLDRGSIGNAKLYHMETDLGITDKQYLIALTAFFFPYALLEPASNVILRRVRPSMWLSSMMFVWGIVMMCHGFIHNYGGLVTLRVLLGVAEAGLYPGIVFYISCWYKRSELGTRVAAFFTSATIAGAFSGLLAAAISNMNGVAGKPGWSWIFILEGLLTVLCAVASYWVISNFPETAGFLTKEERVFVIRRLRDDMQFSAGGEEFKARYIWQSLRDWKTYLAMGIYMGFDGPLFAFSLFTPTIINEVLFDQSPGYTATTANLLSVPVYIWSCIVTVIVGFVGDRLGRRGYINLCATSYMFEFRAIDLPGLVGYIILITSRTPGLSYFACFLASSAWVASNVEGSYKRGVTLAMAIGWGNLNGAVSSNVYRARDAPWYRLGHGIILAYIAIGWLSSAAFMILLRRENERRDRGERDEVINSDNSGEEMNEMALKNGRFETVNDARREKGDEWSQFRYTL
ncbi:MFS general substrate transporter [Suillus clintonianus]|uniref:MFS general substrate transporter n=1 Tax=Suillus clintonianus TaxID=1904413 RepID=UPI001B882BED|nr:MFS general substrate transporter [Suillus clintonianus]KAG2154717.1 MFS general substrate transporter [Suillus clintonianus]